MSYQISIVIAAVSGKYPAPPGRTLLAAYKDLLLSLAEHDEEGGMLRERRRGMEGVDVCTCCTNDQLSICCGACMARAKGKDAHVQSGNPAVAASSADSSVTRTLLNTDRFNTLRRSACRCCMASASQNSRCCHWCTTMRTLSLH